METKNFIRKVTIVSSIFISVLLYGSETWKTAKLITSKLQPFINWFPHRIERYKWFNKITNTELTERTRHIPVNQEVIQTLMLDKTHIKKISQ